jgi:inhibitor of KinA
MTIRFLPAGDTALVVEFGDRIDRELSEAVLALAEKLQRSALKGVTETVPTFRSLLIQYDPLATSAAELTRAIEALGTNDATARRTSRLWHIPACYDASYAPDIEDVAKRSGLSTDEVIARHSGATYHVYMIGFVPGYAYMGDLPKDLQLPRRENPRVRVPAGSIAIATTMTGIYPVESPGGWHLIGASAVRLFDATRPQPSLFAPGDAVRFEPVTLSDHERIARDIASGRYEARGEELRA